MKPLEERLRDLRDENRIHQMKYFDMATSYASVALKTCVMLNAGALALIPTFIEVFDLARKDIDISALSSGMKAFVTSLLFTLLTYVSAYLSCSLGARGIIHHTTKDSFEIAGHEHYLKEGQDLPQAYKEAIDQANTGIRKSEFWCEFTEVISIVFALASIGYFFLGSLKAVSAAGTIF